MAAVNTLTRVDVGLRTAAAVRGQLTEKPIRRSRTTSRFTSFTSDAADA